MDLKKAVRVALIDSGSIDSTSDIARIAELVEEKFTSTNSDYTAALRSTIEAWSHDIGIAELIDDRGFVDLMQRLNTLKSAYCV